MKPDRENINVLIFTWGLVGGLALLLVILGLKRDDIYSFSKYNDARLYSAGLILYAVDNQQHFPTQIGEILPYLRSSNLAPASTNGFELLFKGSFKDLSNCITSRIIVLRSESLPVQSGKWARIYGFADGHCETHFETNGDFAGWENQHSVALNRMR